MKMLRLELAMEKLQDEVTVKQHEVVEALQNSKKELQQIREDWQNEKENSGREVKQIKDRVDKHLMKITKEIDSTKGPTVAFRSRDLTDLKPANEQTLIFKTTSLNEGGGYDNTTGIFTVPVPGTYIFTVQFCIIRHDMYYAIVSDNKDIKKGVFGDRDWGQCYTSYTVDVLEAGSRVWVKHVKGGDLFESPDFWNTFSGVYVNN